MILSSSNTYKRFSVAYLNTIFTRSIETTSPELKDRRKRSKPLISWRWDLNPCFVTSILMLNFFALRLESVCTVMSLWGLQYFFIYLSLCPIEEIKVHSKITQRAISLLEISFFPIWTFTIWKIDFNMRLKTWNITCSAENWCMRIVWLYFTFFTFFLV